MTIDTVQTLLLMDQVADLPSAVQLQRPELQQLHPLAMGGLSEGRSRRFAVHAPGWPPAWHGTG